MLIAKSWNKWLFSHFRCAIVNLVTHCISPRRCGWTVDLGTLGRKAHKVGKLASLVRINIHPVLIPCLPWNRTSTRGESLQGTDKIPNIQKPNPYIMYMGNAKYPANLETMLPYRWTTVFIIQIFIYCNSQAILHMPYCDFFHIYLCITYVCDAGSL